MRVPRHIILAVALLVPYVWCQVDEDLHHTEGETGYYRADDQFDNHPPPGLSHQPTDRAVAPPLHEEDIENQSAEAIYAHVLSVLHTITTHAPSTVTSGGVSYSTASLFHSSAYTPFLDLLENSVGGYGAKVINTLRRSVTKLAGSPEPNLGSNSKGGAEANAVLADRRAHSWSVREMMSNAKASLLSKMPLRGRRASAAAGEGEPKRRPSTLHRLTSGLFSMSNTKLSKQEVEEGLEEVVKLAKVAGEKGSGDAWVLLGDLYLAGHLSITPSPKRALAYYTKASETQGTPEAQYKLGFLYGSNYEGHLGGTPGEGHEGSALLHYMFAASSGHVPSAMAVGYRHWAGIGTKQSCQEALGWYKSAADEAMKVFEAGPPGGRYLPPPKVRLSDLKGGPYGPGASASVRGMALGGQNPQTLMEWQDLLEYYLFHGRRGEAGFMYRLGRLYYQGFGVSGAGGSRSGRRRLGVGPSDLNDGLWEGGRDFANAFLWFRAVARMAWPWDAKDVVVTSVVETRVNPGKETVIRYFDSDKDNKNKPAKVEDTVAMAAGLSAGFLGRMYLRGEAVKQDYVKAFMWFSRGVSHGDKESQNGLGIMYRDGLGINADLGRAKMYFNAASQQDLADAGINLAKMHLASNEIEAATQQFEAAVRHGDTFQSFYYLAELNTQMATSRPEFCPTAVSFYKKVAERGDWEHEVWWEAERAYLRGDRRMALLGYWIMAERGYEAAQNNLAWILDRDKRHMRLPLLDGRPKTNESDRLALMYWTRSAGQDNIDALLKMGDYYYAGIGVDSQPDYEKAASCYQSAANTHISAMAMWNLGWAHERGLGVAQDYHLAKRYYDLALETSHDAYLPVTLSLISLHARSLYNTLFGTDELKSLSLLSSPKAPEADATPWSLSKTLQEMKKRWSYDEHEAHRTPTTGDAEQDRAQEERDRRFLDGTNEEWEAQQQQDDRDEEFLLLDGDGDSLEVLVITVLCFALAWVVWFRQGRLDGIIPPGAAQPQRQEAQDEDEGNAAL